MLLDVAHHILGVVKLIVIDEKVLVAGGRNDR